LAALEHVWLIRIAHALARILGLLQENEANRIDTGTGTCEKMEDEDYEKRFYAYKAPGESSYQADKRDERQQTVGDDLDDEW